MVCFLKNHLASSDETLYELSKAIPTCMHIFTYIYSYAYILLPTKQVLRGIIVFEE